MLGAFLCHSRTSNPQGYLHCSCSVCIVQRKGEDERQSCTRPPKVNKPVPTEKDKTCTFSLEPKVYANLFGKPAKKRKLKKKHGKSNKGGTKKANKKTRGKNTQDTQNTGGHEWEDASDDESISRIPRKNTNSKKRD